MSDSELVTRLRLLAHDLREKNGDTPQCDYAVDTILEAARRIQKGGDR